MRARLSAVCIISVTLSACGGGGRGGGAAPVAATPPVGGGGASSSIRIDPAFPNLSFSEPLLLIQAPGDSTRWFIVERAGVIRVFANDAGVSTSTVVTDLRSVVDSGPNEAGLLGMAIHPDFANNGHVYLSFTVSGSPLVSRIERITSIDGGQTLDLTTRTLILSVDQDFGNHNGGHLAFGPDGLLYIGFGDGGGAGDTNGRGQQTNNLLGTLVRIDIDAGIPYAIPGDNPFAGNPMCMQGVGAAACPEIFAFGLRNPWRWSFDRLTGDLIAGDVGQNSFEEIDRITIGNNFGWNIREAANCFEANSCVTAGLVDPIHQYDRTQGASVTGGYVYRGTDIPALSGQYVFADFISGRIWSIDAAVQTLSASELLIESGLNIASFGESNDGELYIVNFGGTLHQLVAE